MKFFCLLCGYLYAEAVMSAGRAGELSGCGRMPCPKRFLDVWFENRMTLRADVRNLPEIPAGHPDTIRNRSNSPYHKQPPDPICDSQNDGQPLKDAERYSGEKQDRMDLLKFFFVCHYIRYVAYGFDRDLAQALQTGLQLLQFLQLFFPFFDFIFQNSLLLIQN